MLNVLGVLFLLDRELLVQNDFSHLLEDIGMVVVDGLQHTLPLLFDNSEEPNELAKA